MANRGSLAARLPAAETSVKQGSQLGQRAFGDLDRDHTVDAQLAVRGRPDVLQRENLWDTKGEGKLVHHPVTNARDCGPLPSLLLARPAPWRAQSSRKQFHQSRPSKFGRTSAIPGAGWFGAPVAFPCFCEATEQGRTKWRQRRRREISVRCLCLCSTDVSTSHRRTCCWCLPAELFV